MKKSRNNSKKKKIKISGIKIKLEPGANSAESKKQEESGLEEQIEESEIIEDKEFHHFLVSDKTPPPVLQKIESKEMSLEEDVASAPMPKTKQEGNVMDYSQGNYFSSSYGAKKRNYEEPVTSPVLERTRTATSEHITKGELLDWREQSQVRENTSIPTERERMHIKTIEARHDELPFEKRERKYR